MAIAPEYCKERNMVGTARWQDWTSFGLGLWLAVSPWIVGYDPEFAAAAKAGFLRGPRAARAPANAVLVGVALAMGAHFNIVLDELWTEWLNFAAGLWLLGAPFFLEFWT